MPGIFSPRYLELEGDFEYEPDSIEKPIKDYLYREEPTDQDVVFAEQSLVRVRNDLFSRRKEQERRLGIKVRRDLLWTRISNHNNN